MPVFRPPPRRSARLQALYNRHIYMVKATQKTTANRPSAPSVAPAPKRRSQKTPAAPNPALAPAPNPTPTGTTKKPSPHIQWEGPRTELLVDWITTHLADRHVLFHDRASSAATSRLPSDDKPSGKTKKDVAKAIALHIFGKDPEHAASFTEDSTRYVTSVINRLNALKAKYRQQRGRFKQTGGGVAPRGENSDGPANLLEDVLRDFPHYEKLHTIWNNIPSFDGELVSSKPNNDHAGSLLDVVRSRASGSKNVASESGENEDRDGLGDEDCDLDAVGDVGGADRHEYGTPEMDDNQAPDAELEVDQDMADAMSTSQHVPARQGQPAQFSIPSKGKTPVRDGPSAFTRYSPYSRPSSDANSSATSSRKASSTKKPPSSTNPFSAKLQELDHLSDMLIEEGSGHSSSKALRYTFAIRKQELDNQREELNMIQANADADFQHQQELKKLDIQAHQVESNKISQQIELLRTQMALQAQMMAIMQASPGNAMASGPTPTAVAPSAATFLPGSNPFFGLNPFGFPGFSGSLSSGAPSPFMGGFMPGTSGGPISSSSVAHPSSSTNSSTTQAAGTSSTQAVVPSSLNSAPDSSTSFRPGGSQSLDLYD